MYGCTNYSTYEFSHDDLIGIGRDNYVPHRGDLYVAHPMFSDNCGLMVYLKNRWNSSGSHLKNKGFCNGDKFWYR